MCVFAFVSSVVEVGLIGSRLRHVVRVFLVVVDVVDIVGVESVGDERAGDAGAV